MLRLVALTLGVLFGITSVYAANTHPTVHPHAAVVKQVIKSFTISNKKGVLLPGIT